MCGICGAISQKEPVKPELIGAMISVLRHRGPDDRGSYSNQGENPPHVAFGHSRLSIIDLTSGHQPMSNEDGNIWVTYNGEIYNFRELKRDLEQRGHRFTTKTDTEVIVHLYEEKGEECVREFRGMFSFAIWDERQKTLFAARDRLGQKPFYYGHTPDRFVFASEIKAIIQDENVARRVDHEALHHYLTYQYVPHPRTMFAGIRKLPPGHWLRLTNGKLEVREYWRVPQPEPARKGFEEWCSELREVMEECVRLRLVSDVPLGAFLSGGIDSAITVGLMSRLTGEPVRTFAIGFDDPLYDETGYASRAAEAFGTEHREFRVTPDAMEILPKLVWHYDEPLADSSAIPTYYVSLHTSRHVKVALTGDAGDECFAGYPRYVATKIAAFTDRVPWPLRLFFCRRLWRRLPAPPELKSSRARLKKLVLGFAQEPVERYLSWISAFDEKEKSALYDGGFARSLEGVDSSEYLRSLFGRFKGDPVARTAAVDLSSYLPCDLLTKVDVASMANSLESRSPFLDHRLVEFAATIPTEYKLHGFRTKHVLRETFKDILPPEIAKRKKMGFGVPIARWFREELRDFAKDILLSKEARERGYFRREPIEDLIDEHVDGREDNAYKLWCLLLFELWHRKFIDPPIAPSGI
jgi:asparagine synthase (glutamine-hydrolysing)